MYTYGLSLSQDNYFLSSFINVVECLGTESSRTLGWSFNINVIYKGSCVLRGLTVQIMLYSLAGRGLCSHPVRLACKLFRKHKFCLPGGWGVKDDKAQAIWNLTNLTEIGCFVNCCHSYPRHWQYSTCIIFSPMLCVTRTRPHSLSAPNLQTMRNFLGWRQSELNFGMRPKTKTFCK